MKRVRYENGDVDVVDLRLIQALASDARASLADLSRFVGLSAPSVSERIRRLEEAGVIEGYTVKINPKALGLPLAFWLRIRPTPGNLQKVSNLLQTLESIVECDRVTGEDCFLAKAHVQSVEALERLIDKLIPFAMTNTALIQSSPVARRLPSIDVQG
jgi:Lrp/AsnC family leucine-responsive transcriptional regulator